MSAIDKVRSFAEARSHDYELVRDGLTYGDCREILAEVERLDKLFRQLCCDVTSDLHGCKPTCDSYAHSETCPVANPGELFRGLKDDNRVLRRALCNAARVMRTTVESSSDISWTAGEWTVEQYVTAARNELGVGDE